MNTTDVKKKGKIEKNKIGWHENPSFVNTPNGIRNIAKRHHEVSHKKHLETTLRQPLVAVDDPAQVKVVQKTLKARNPIDEIKNIRNRYQGEYAIIRETMQNSERAGRSNHVPVDIIITITPDKFRIEDNAGGVDKQSIDAVFNLGQSGWDLDMNTNAFGQGFMSFILLFNNCEIISNDIDSEFDWQKIESEYDKSKHFDLSKAYTAQEASSPDAFNARNKFIAVFTKPLETYDYKKAIEQAKNYAKTLPVRSITINGELANNKIDFANTPRGFKRVEKPYKEGIGVIGYFAPGTEDDAIRFYFQGLPVGPATSDSVDNYFYKLQALMGDVNINTTFYGRPSENRDSWIQDKNIELTVNLIKGLAKEIAIDIIKYGSESQIEKYQHFVSRYTTFDDILYHVRFEVIAPEVIDLVTKSERARHPEMNEEQFQQYMGGIFNSPTELNQAMDRAKDYNVKMDVDAYNKSSKELLEKRKELQEQQPEDHEKEKVLEEEEQQLQESQRKQEDRQVESKQKLTEFIESRDEGGYTVSKWNKHTFWCKRQDAMFYTNEIKMASYYRVPIAIADNRFQEKAFGMRDNFHHIEELRSSVTNVPAISVAGARNAQERRIEYIFRVFLDAAGFNNVKIVIANIEFKRVVHVPHSNVKLEEPMEVGAYADNAENSIYIQRKLSFGHSDDGAIDGYYGIKALYPYLSYNDYSLENKSIGQGDIAVFSKARKLLAHELAHIVDHTTDNTDTHFKSMLRIDTQFDNVIANFKASSKLSDSQSGIKQKAKERLGLQSDDTVVVTYTKGALGELEKSAPIVKISPNEIIINEGGILRLKKDLTDITGYKPTGYRIGDYVNIKDGDSTSVVKIIRIGAEGNHTLFVEHTDGNKEHITFDAILSKADNPIKYRKIDIFRHEISGKAKTFGELMDMFDNDYNRLIQSDYKPTDIRIGDTVEIKSTGEKSIIKKVELGGVDTGSGYFYLGDLKKVESASPPPTTNVMYSIFQKVVEAIRPAPLTYSEIIQVIPDLQNYKKPQNTLWSIVKKYGIDKGIIEYTDSKPVKLKLKEVK